MRSEWAPKGEIVHVLAALSPENRLACEISLFTGLRINDVLALKPKALEKRRFTIREEKTGKTRRVYLPEELRKRALACAGQHFVFEHRTNRCKQHITPHSLRKVYAVEEYARTGDLKRVQNLLNHSSEAVTMLYALANVVRKRKNYEKS